jgi:hypothetical protein
MMETGFKIMRKRHKFIRMNKDTVKQHYDVGNDKGGENGRHHRNGLLNSSDIQDY